MITETMGRPGPRRLPSADWVAFGIGLAAMFLSYLRPALMGLVAVAVFAPSALRELGILRDADEYTLGVMRRAGFHAALAVAAMLALDYGLALAGLYPAEPLSDATVLGAETLRKAAVWVFLLSYLIQYWGARGGAVRVLLGVAVMSLAPLVAFLRPDLQESMRPLAGTMVVVTVANAVVLAGLALVVRRWPRAGGGLLVVACVAFLAVMAGTGLDNPRARWGVIAAMVQAALVYGVTGVALLRETSIKEADL